MSDITSSNSEFYKAIRTSNVQRLRELLAQGFRIDEWDDIPLSEAILTRQIEIIQLLLEAGFDPNHDCYIGGTTPLERAIEGSNIETVAFLLKSGADPKFGGGATTPLMCAVSRGDVGVIKMLIRAGVTVNSSSEGGWTPLMEAASNGNLHLVRFLIKLGADPNETDTDGETALVKAAEHAQQEVFDFLYPLTSCSRQQKIAQQRLLDDILCSQEVDEVQ